MLNSEETNTKPDPNAGELDPPVTEAETELGRLAVEYVRNHPPQKEAAT